MIGNVMKLNWNQNDIGRGKAPTGTGVSARLALHYHKGEIGQNETVAIESILGRAFITGRHEFLLDSGDSLGGGFLIS